MLLDSAWPIGEEKTSVTFFVSWELISILVIAVVVIGFLLVRNRRK